RGNCVERIDEPGCARNKSAYKRDAADGPYPYGSLRVRALEAAHRPRRVARVCLRHQQGRHSAKGAQKVDELLCVERHFGGDAPANGFEKMCVEPRSEAMDLGIVELVGKRRSQICSAERRVVFGLEFLDGEVVTALINRRGSMAVTGEDELPARFDRLV